MINALQTEFRVHQTFCRMSSLAEEHQKLILDGTKIAWHAERIKAWEKGERNFCNHLTLDGVYNWKLGTAVIWERNQLHASSDFTKHHKYKDAITTFFE